MADSKNLVWSDRKRTLFGLPLSFTKYELFDDRLIITTGLFNVREEEVRLYRILDLALERNLGQRIFGVGSIAVDSSDRSAGNFVIQSVKDSRRVKELLSDMVEEQRDKKRVVSREMMGMVYADDADDDMDDDSEE